jgi:transcriptional regulator with XRE-family HTH domain
LIQADVAVRAGISESRLSRIANGRVEPYDYEIRNLARALGVPRELLVA